MAYITTPGVDVDPRWNPTGRGANFYPAPTWTAGTGGCTGCGGLGAEYDFRELTREETAKRAERGFFKSPARAAAARSEAFVQAARAREEAAGQRTWLIGGAVALGGLLLVLRLARRRGEPR